MNSQIYNFLEKLGDGLARAITAFPQGSHQLDPSSKGSPEKAPALKFTPVPITQQRSTAPSVHCQPGSVPSINVEILPTLIALSLTPTSSSSAVLPALCWSQGLCTNPPALRTCLPLPWSKTVFLLSSLPPFLSHPHSVLHITPREICVRLLSNQSTPVLKLIQQLPFAIRIKCKPLSPKANRAAPSSITSAPTHHPSPWTTTSIFPSP